MRDATRVVHAGRQRPGQGEPFLAGPVFAAPYRHAGDPGGDPYTYGRTSNPTWTAYEAALAELEGGPCLVLASGMAAVSAVLLATLHPGDVVVLPSDSYWTTRATAREQLASRGVQVREAPTAGGAQAAQLEGTRLLWLETPSNPALDVCDVPALAAAAHAAGALVAVDNTTATVLGQQPLALGADYSVCSDTKATTGHGDLLLGHVAVRDPALLAPLLTWRSQVGAVPGPLETWLAHRSLATLDVRLRRQCATALHVAEGLRGLPGVTDVRYPWLPGSPGEALARRQMRHAGPVVSFTLPDAATADAFVDALRLVLPATSFGGVHATAERRARWGGDAVAPGWVRFSAGLEDAEDVLADLRHALAVAVARTGSAGS